MQNISKSPAAEGKGSYSALARNIAIVVAALAITYSQLAPHFGDKGEVSKAPETSPAAVAAVATESVDTVVTPPQARPVPPGGLDIGSDANAQAFRDFLKAKADEINKAGPVVYVQAGEPVATTAHSSTTNPQPELGESHVAPGTAPQAVTATQPVSSSAQTTESPDGTRWTKHPAPFVDQQALASIQEHREAVAKSGQVAVVKIGTYPDGMPMPESVKREQIRSTLSTIPDEWTVTYKAPNEKLRIYAFTDPTCPYCKKLHKALPQLLEAGISVHYLLYPRDMATVPAGQLSDGAHNLKNVWCAVDQVSAMNDAFAGYRVPEADCAALPKSLNRLPAPVPDHYNLGDMFNVTGTPTLMASNGKNQAGFGTAQQIIQDFLD
jgi:protein-disulfide isomerase